MSGPWRTGQRYGIYKGTRRVLEGDGSTTVEERQSIADSLNRDYAGDSEPAQDPVAAMRLMKAAPALLEALRDLREACVDAYKTGRVSAEPFVRAGNVIAEAEGK